MALNDRFRQKPTPACGFNAPPFATPLVFENDPRHSNRRLTTPRHLPALSLRSARARRSPAHSAEGSNCEHVDGAHEQTVHRKPRAWFATASGEADTARSRIGVAFQHKDGIGFEIALGSTSRRSAAACDALERVDRGQTSGAWVVARGQKDERLVALPVMARLIA